jgi:hypothetical protein
MHYELASESVAGVLREILLDMSTFKHIHNWDEKLLKDSWKSIVKLMRTALGKDSCTFASLTAHSTVEEIEEISSINKNNAVATEVEPGTEESYLFFAKVRRDPYHKLRTGSS